MIPPDETAICRFRHFLEENQLADVIFKTVNAHLDKKGLVLKSGTIVDATLLDAPVSKKNEAHTRDPEMSSTKKNNKWHFGAKGHIGVQANGKPLIHSLAFTTAKEADINGLDSLLHGEEQAKLRYKGLEKNASRFKSLCALCNIYMCRKLLIA
jgi:IS5 family transposase